VREQLEALTAERLRGDFRRRFTPRGAILSVAGLFDWDALKDQVEASFGGWRATAGDTMSGSPGPRGTFHEKQETNQVQIGLAFDSIPDSHPDSILVQTMLNVLSGGMGARLFSEVREKQGLWLLDPRGIPLVQGPRGDFRLRRNRARPGRSARSIRSSWS